MTEKAPVSKEDALRALQELLRELSPARAQKDLDLAAKMVGVLISQESEAVPDPSPEHVADVELPHLRSPAHRFVADLLKRALLEAEILGPDDTPFGDFISSEGRQPFAEILVSTVKNHPSWPGSALFSQAMADTLRDLWDLFLPGLTVREVQTGHEPKYELWCGSSQGRAYLRNFRYQGLLKEAEDRKFYRENQRSNMSEEQFRHWQDESSADAIAAQLGARCERCQRWTRGKDFRQVGDCSFLERETTEAFYCAHFISRWPGDGEVAP